ncbi:acyl-CoA thioesterase II [Conexibacter sp. CPCC 206217]|uniref:acyl-CoA thioesterase n=1 Tax=Conexibacter sp. CPCC 206217 TaxID=3064574 RepID=UPI002717E407|nr:thioesterase family protein [Conexibacter sp. CPCC 206217]MDO8211791.1 thioesterase family protein [Conexibacter sp. CPCC 206217]
MSSFTPARSFDDATALRPLCDGRFAADVDLGWAAPTAANGGYLAAIVVRAILAHADPLGERRLRSLTIHYLRPAGAGPLELTVELVRTGRRISNVRVSAIQDGREVLSALAALAVPALPAAGTWLPDPPVVAPAPPREAPRIPAHEWRRDDSAHWLQVHEAAPAISHRVQLAPRFGGAPFSGRQPEHGEPAQAGGWITLPQPHAVDAAYVALCADVWWPPGFEPLDRPAVAPTIDLTIHFRADIPPAGLPDQAVLGWYRSSAAQDGLVEEDGLLFLGDGTLLAHSRQLAIFMPA